MRKKDEHFYDKMIKCDKCGKWSKKDFVDMYGSCLCGNILDKKAKYRYEMFCKLHLWRNKNYRRDQIERNKYD